MYSNLTVPQLKERCHDAGIPYSYKWKKADFVAALSQMESKKLVSQPTFSNKYSTCDKCHLMQPFAVDYDGNALCGECAIGVDYQKLTDQEIADSNAYCDIFWNNQKLLFENTAGCVIPLEQTDWYSLDAPLNKIFEKHLKELRISYEYEWDETFSTNYKDYVLVGTTTPLNFDQTLGDLLASVSGGILRYPEIPSLLILAQNAVRKTYDKAQLMKHKILPGELMKEL